MIVSKIIGGLGNQMFQYAAARALSLKHGVSLKLDLRGFENYKLHHGYELNNIFNIKAAAVCEAEMRSLLGWQGSRRMANLLRRKSFGILRNKSFVCEPHFEYWSGFENIKDDVYIDGYWQSERYFSDYSDEIRKDFTFTSPLSHDNFRIASLIDVLDSVSLHVRRGDYVANPKNKFLDVCDIHYYKNAVEQMMRMVAKPHFFVFSDDLDWVKDNIIINAEVMYVENNRGQDSYNDMRIMSLCKNNITANSTFSWWAAWLNSNKGKKVITPSSWFAGNLNSKDLIPDGWIKILSDDKMVKF